MTDRKLTKLLKAFEDAAVAKSWKGTMDWPAINKRYKEARTKLLAYITAKRRISNAFPSDAEQCEWCHEVKPTTVCEVWSEADQEGRLTRVCKECASRFAGG